jgi:DivIVA domain-containing protein
MELSPQSVRNAQFKTARKGLDPAEVRAYLTNVADELERAQNQATAMEARARAAVARMQELTENPPPPAAPEAPAATADESETISRTLLLAQRTADQTLAEARHESERVREEADQEATRTIEGSRETAARLLEQARVEAREVDKEERLALAAEVNALMARRDFLESDVEHLEQFLVAQRARLREAAASIVDLTERVPSGLGEVRRPLLSASDDPTGSRTADPDEDTDPYGMPAQDGPDGPDEPDVAAGVTADDGGTPTGDADGSDVTAGQGDAPPNAPSGAGDAESNQVTAELAGLVAETDEESPPSPYDPTPSGGASDDAGFRLRFDDPA